ncbi:MAG TPA: NAD(P)H-hydrate dehydratase [Niabella sp.]|nr:NAD(P)H-hydrate dehydratase [Chitinophagaceae bacterium]HRN49046.1 NAD(P)H-hydrate dehydratase [Niabella sp.]HRO84829.1 NAD(P)H-hydrate dehydratase [Niabella sp.]
MKLLTAKQIREWDQYTIHKEPITSIELMERAARACTKWLLQNTLADSYYIFCGKGNNGGDGLAIARMMADAHHEARVFILESDAKGSLDFNINFTHLHQKGNVPITLLRSENDFPVIPENVIVIDALFGTGLNKTLEGNGAALVEYLNTLSNGIVSIDIPSGMFCDKSSAGNTVVSATHTLTFQVLKMAFLIAENENNFGQVHILDISLHPEYLENIQTKFQLINKTTCKSIHNPRNLFSHKGDFGHALLMAGSYGKMGAAVLSAKACMKSGAGLLTCHLPECGLYVMQTAVPEAMCIVDKESRVLSAITDDISKYSAVGIGPGIGTHSETSLLINSLINNYSKPLVLDADALNILSQNKEWLKMLPPYSILTPHPKEFSRLFGEGMNDFEKIEMALLKAKELNVIILIKGHYSFIALPDGSGYFNITGNAGMATGGSGDVLTGILTGLMAQGYKPEEVVVFGVFLHGLAGDLASGKVSMEALVASDIIENIGNAYLAINQG